MQEKSIFDICNGYRFWQSYVNAFFNIDINIFLIAYMYWSSNIDA